jgi:hypothetical protein
MCYVIVQNAYAAQDFLHTPIFRQPPYLPKEQFLVQDHIFYISSFGSINLTFLIGCIKV